MPVTKDQAAMLASLAIACRPNGAPHWEAPGVVAAIAKVANLHLPDVALATIRAAMDPTANTPGVIASTSSVHWHEKTQAISPRETPARERCNDCGKPELHPLHPTDHPFERVRRTECDASAEVAHLRGLIRTAPKEQVDG